MNEGDLNRLWRKLQRPLHEAGEQIVKQYDDMEHLFGGV